MNPVNQSPVLPEREFQHFKVTPVTPVIGGMLEGLHLSELNDESAADLFDPFGGV